MKRSEMLQKLSIDVSAIRSTTAKEGSDIKLASVLLSHIERLGMLPPSTNYFVDNFPDEMHWEQVHDYHRWDPE